MAATYFKYGPQPLLKFLNAAFNATSGHDHDGTNSKAIATAVSTTSAQTLTNKTLTTPIVASIYQDAGKTKLMTVPDVASDTIAVIGAAQTLTNKTLTTPVISSLYKDAGGTKEMTVPDVASDTLAVIGAAQTFTSKTLTAPVINDGLSSARKNIVNIAGDGAITIADGIVSLSKGSAAAITLAASSAPNAGAEICIISNSAYAHVVTFTGSTLDGGEAAALVTATFDAKVGACLTVVAFNSRWVVKAFNNVTLA